MPFLIDLFERPREKTWELNGGRLSARGNGGAGKTNRKGKEERIQQLFLVGSRHSVRKKRDDEDSISFIDYIGGPRMTQINIESYELGEGAMRRRGSGQK